MNLDDRTPKQILPALIVFGVAFGLLEAVVVVYLRQVYYPAGFAFPIVMLPDTWAIVEVIREAATIAMLWAAAALAGRSRWERFGWFSLLFGVWDIIFYLALFTILRWPESIMTWDILFLIPLIWTGPVLAPLLVSLLLIAGGSLLALRTRAASRFIVKRGQWLCGSGGLLLMLYAFMANHGVTAAGEVPVTFPWFAFLAGWLLAACVGWHALRVNRINSE
ncbi:MAG: hypothetical protein GY835_16700 [bacterium]|nr:hypothetical protein [bacterium]